MYTHNIYIYVYTSGSPGPRAAGGTEAHGAQPASELHTARVLFGANAVIQVLSYCLSSPIRQIVRKECN